MNDFTKEELEELKDLTEFEISEYGQQSSKSINLLIPMFNKLHTLIVNYCYHKNTRNGDPCQECVDCGKQI